MIVLFKEIVDWKVPRSLALCHSNCLQTRFPFEYTQINITLTHTHPHTRCIIYVKELSVRLSTVSTNDAYEYERKMGVFAFNLRGMRLCTLTIMGTDVSVPLRIRIIQFNSIQFDTTLLRYGPIWFRFRLRFYFSAYQIKTRNQSVVGAKRIPTPFTCIVCVCVCQWQRIEEQKSLKSASGRATRHEDKDECMSAVTGSTSTSASAAAFIVVIVGRCFQLKSNKKQPYASTMHHTPVATWA